MRRMPWIALSLLAFALAAPGAGATRLSYEKYKLGNGMTVILHEDHSVPLVAVNLWYRVGGKEEREGRSGFAHLFEHLMFMGTFRVPTGQFDKIMEGGGGSNNASTSNDRTNYFSSGPSSLLPTLLWLDADRLETLGKAMTPEKLEVQREVVLNEKKQSYDNAPYGPSELVMQAELYPPGHPYRWDVIGKDEDIKGATVKDVTDFFETYYVPNNCTLVVAGDFDRAETKRLVQSFFGSIPAKREPPRRTAPPVVLSQPKRLTLFDKVSLPRVSFVWHSPAFYAPGDAELDLAASALAEGKDSRLYQRLVVKERLAQEVSAYQASADLGSLFRIDVTAMPDANLDRVETVIGEEVRRLTAEGPTAEEVARARIRIETRMLEGLQSLSSLADQLNNYDFHFGEPDSLDRDLDRYRKATPAAVREWAARVMDRRRRLTCRVLPNPRDDRPEDLPEKPFEPALPEVFRTSSGLEVWHFDRPTLPLVSLSLLSRAGSTRDPGDRGGTASLTASMLEEGTTALTSAAFAKAMQALGASFGVGADRDTSSASLEVLRKNFDPALDLFASAIRDPRMGEEDWTRVKSIHLSDLEANDDDPGELARRVAVEQYFGGDSPYGHVPSGVRATVEKTTLDEVRAFHRANYAPSNALLLVAGDVRRKDLEASLERAFGGWASPDQPGTPEAAPVSPAALRVLVVDRPGSPQTVVRFVLPGGAWSDPDRVALDVTNVALGGSFSSRLNDNLREKHSYTYGASSSFARWKSEGFFVASAQVRGDVVGASVKEFLAELKRAKTGDFTEAEAQKARSQWRNSLVETYQTLSGILGEQSDLVVNGAAPETVRGDMEKAAAVTAADMNRLAAKIDLEHGLLVLVGDGASIVAQLADLGLPQPEFVTPR